MLGKSHLLVGAAGYLTIGQTVLVASGHGNLSVGEIAAGTIVCAGAAMLPDIDHPNATVSRSLGPVTWFVSRAVSKLAGGHRKGTHSLPFALAISLFLAWALREWPSHLLPLLICFFLVSLLARVLTEADGAICAVISAGVASACVMGAPETQVWLPLAVGLGCLLHMAGDAVTTEGIPIMWPLSKENVAFPVVGNTGGSRERLVAVLAGLVTVVFYAHLVVVPALFH